VTPDDRSMTITITGTYVPCPSCRRAQPSPGTPILEGERFGVRQVGVSYFITPHKLGCGAGL
jgi:hypothetical protein